MPTPRSAIRDLLRSYRSARIRIRIRIALQLRMGFSVATMFVLAWRLRLAITPEAG